MEHNKGRGWEGREYKGMGRIEDEGREIREGNQGTRKVYIEQEIRLSSTLLGVDAKVPKCHLFSHWKVSSRKKDDTSAFQQFTISVHTPHEF